MSFLLAQGRRNRGKASDAPGILKSTLLDHVPFTQNTCILLVITTTTNGDILAKRKIDL